jgi:SAM-dependent methyltransferase
VPAVRNVTIGLRRPAATVVAVAERDDRRPYRGTAGDYHRFRLPYPDGLLAAVLSRCTPGALLDLACGPGPVVRPLAPRFAEVLAVDAEPGMIERLRELAPGVPAVCAAVEDLDRPPASADLITIGTAFHRLPRDLVAARCLRWLKPGGLLALLWAPGPWEGPRPWQRAAAAVATRWAGPVPVADRSHAEVLVAAGFAAPVRLHWPVEHTWTADAVLGHAHSTAVLSRAALGPDAPAFAAELRAALAGHGPLTQTVDFAADLTRPAPNP